MACVFTSLTCRAHSCAPSPFTREKLKGNTTKGNMRFVGAVIASLAIGYVAAASITPTLNITALSSHHGYSVLQCWQLSSIPLDFMAATNYAIGNTTMATWSRIEPRTTVGEAWAPHVQ